MASSNSDNNRHLRKRIAARLRQQRCRARKRQAKVAQSSEPDDSVRGPVLNFRTPPNYVRQFPNHSTSSFVMYPRRVSIPYTNPAPAAIWSPSPQHGILYSRPKPEMIKVPLSPACRSPLTTQQPPNIHEIPRVSPGSVPTTYTTEADNGLLERQEETAISAMLSLRRTGSGSSLSAGPDSCEQWTSCKPGQLCTSV